MSTSNDNQRHRDVPSARRSYISRRKLFVLGFMAMCAAFAGFVLSYRRSTLEAFLDTLIPRDEFGPSATDIGLTDIIRQKAERNHWRFVELELAQVWMNLKAGGSFAGASEARRNEIVSQMEASGPDSVLWKAYHFARTHCMTYYYANAERATALGFVGPPQPDGHEEPAALWTGAANG